MSDLTLLVGIGEDEVSKTLIRGLPAKHRWHVVSFTPTTLSETIQLILLGKATLSFDYNEHINVVSENGMATTVQRMDERLDKLENLLKSCQLSSYSVVCDKYHIHNSIRGYNICDGVYKGSYNMCVTKLKMTTK